MTESEARSGRWTRWLWGVGLAVTLTMLYVYLANENVATFHLVHDGGQVQIHKGMYTPWGTEAFEPTDAFAPIRVDADVAVRAGECADLPSCEARLYELAVRQARRLLARPDQLLAARELIAQARKLSPKGQEEELLELQGDEQYALGVGHLEEVGRLLLEARKNFARAQAMDAGTFRDGRARVETVDGLLVDLRQAGVRVPEVPMPRGDPGKRAQPMPTTPAPSPSLPAAPAQPGQSAATPPATSSGPPATAPDPNAVPGPAGPARVPAAPAPDPGHQRTGERARPAPDNGPGVTPVPSEPHEQL